MIGLAVMGRNLALNINDHGFSVAAWNSREALASCDFVVEAAPESESLKLKIFQAMDAATRPQAILASNTSSISITKLGAVTRRPRPNSARSTRPLMPS